MNEPTHTLQFGDAAIEYTLNDAPRKTLAISVHPDCSVTVKAPAGSDFAAVEAFLRKRAAWILRKQAEFAVAPSQPPPRRYVSGENFAHLGRQYRLSVTEGEREWVKLTRTHLEVITPNKADTAYVRAQVDAWLRRQAQRYFYERVVVLLPRFHPLVLPEPELGIRAMKSRWGSCTGKGKITLNLHLMRVPQSCIDYVIVHELCHLIELNHSKRFYTLLEKVMPDWQTRRERLKQVEIA
ncbi:MAG: M48 family metallopeptidase [Anaerolineales bacterium]|nr:M48 family metallopeptidase [Anaerolineales bacterium]